MSEKTRPVSGSEFDTFRAALEPSDAPEPRHGGFNPEEILRDWTPDMERYMWQAPLKLNTRVNPRRSRAVQPPSSRRSVVLAAVVLLIALLIAAGLYLAVQLLEPDGGEPDSDEDARHAPISQGVF